MTADQGAPMSFQLARYHQRPQSRDHLQSKGVKRGVRRVVLLVVRPGAPSSFMLLLVRHLLLEAMHLLLVASCSL